MAPRAILLLPNCTTCACRPVQAVHFRTRMLGLLPGAHAVAHKWLEWAPRAPDDVFPMLVLPAGKWRSAERSTEWRSAERSTEWRSAALL